MIRKYRFDSIEQAEGFIDSLQGLYDVVFIGALNDGYIGVDVFWLSEPVSSANEVLPAKPHHSLPDGTIADHFEYSVYRDRTKNSGRRIDTSKI